VFLGRFEHNLDEKGRLAIPAKFRPELHGGLVLTRGIDRCLSIYPTPEWSRISERMSSLSITDPNARNLRRMFFSEAVDCELDRQGRVVIPLHLREYASLGSDPVVIVGMDSYIEAWSRGRWAQIEEKVEEEGPSIAERLANLI
jgi:MraZ protein